MGRFGSPKGVQDEAFGRVRWGKKRVRKSDVKKVSSWEVKGGGESFCA